MFQSGYRSIFMAGQVRRVDSHKHNSDRGFKGSGEPGLLGGLRCALQAADPGGGTPAGSARRRCRGCRPGYHRRVHPGLSPRGLPARQRPAARLAVRHRGQQGSRRLPPRRPGELIADKTDGTLFFSKVEDAKLQQAWEDEWNQAVLRQCLAQVREELPARSYEAFQLFALEQLPAREVARRLQVSEDFVYQVKHRVLARIRELAPVVDADC